MRLLLFSAVFLLSGVYLIAAGRPEPQPQIDTFFKDLSEKGGAAAVKELCDGTLLEAQKGVQLEGYAAQVETSIKVYGKVSRIENVDKKLFGQSFVRLRLISFHDSGTPVFWQFLFYHVKDEWQVYQFRFSDQFDRIFSDTQ